MVTPLDDQTLALPDWRGNNRIDTLRNIVADGRISLLFMVPGSDTVVRVNGQAKITTDAALCTRFEVDGRHPRSVIIVRIAEIYTQCARALMRARLWVGDDESTDLPSVGDLLAEASEGALGGAEYDAGWAEAGKKVDVVEERTVFWKTFQGQLQGQNFPENFTISIEYGGLYGPPFRLCKALKLRVDRTIATGQRGFAHGFGICRMGVAGQGDVLRRGTEFHRDASSWIISPAAGR